MASTVEQSKRADLPAPQSASPHHPIRSITGAIGSYFIIRIAARASYGILSTYFAQKVTDSATIAAIVVTVFFISELGLAPIFGNLSDRFGRRPGHPLDSALGSNAPVAQRIEHLTTDQEVGGSNPFERT